jgi:hypothetical protein
MTTPTLIDVSALTADLDFCVGSLSCDPPAKLAQSRCVLQSLVSFIRIVLEFPAVL